MERFRGALALAFMMAIGAPGAADAATPALPSPVVQQREVGPVLLAQRFETPDTNAQQKLTVVIKPNNEWTTQTLLDFDRDGQPDALVNIYVSSPGASTVTWQSWRLSKGTVNQGLGTGAPPCFTAISGTNATRVTIPGSGPAAIVKRANSWAVTIDADFSALAVDGTDETARYGPRMITMYTNAARSMGSYNTVLDYLPNTAAPAVAVSDTACLGRPDGQSNYSTGVGVIADRGTDRGQSTVAALRRQTMLDRADQGATATDLLQADVEQWDAERPDGDVTADLPGNGAVVTHPADLVLHFADRGEMNSATYLFKGSDTGPSGMVLTQAAPRAAGAPVTQVEVQLNRALAGITGDKCYPRARDAALSGGGTWGPANAMLRVILPVVDDAQGHPTVRIDLDPVLGIYTGGAGDEASFRWIATSVAGPVSPDYAPDLAKPDVAGACTYPLGGEGTTLWPSRAVGMSPSVPDATLTPSTSSPDRSVPITLTAGGTGTHFRFDPQGDGLFTADSTTPTTTSSYALASTARVYVTNAAGTANMAEARVTPANPPPVAAITADKDNTYVLGSGILQPSWSDTSSDLNGPATDGSIAAHAWRLTSSRLAAPVQDKLPTFSHTFNPGDQGVYTLTLTTTDNQGATDTTSTTFEIVQPPVAIIDRTTPCTSPGPDYCSTGDGPIICDTSAGCRYRAWARVAPDGSLGSRGPLHYFFDWGVRDADGNSIFYDWTNLGYGDSFFPFAGTYKIRMKVLDADGRASISPYATVRTRRANELPPTARLSSMLASPPKAGDAVLFDASASVLNNLDGSTVPAQHFRYDFGDGSDPLDTPSPTASHVYTGSARYRASVVVVDDRDVLSTSESDPAELLVPVATGPGDTNAPQAVATRLTEGKVYANRDVQLSAATSTILDAPAHFRWDLDGDGTFETDGGTQAVINARFPSAGHREVRVSITDAAGREGTSAPLGINVLGEPVIPPTVVLEGPDTVTVSGGVATAALDASKSMANNDEPGLTFEWDLDGDGVYETATGPDPHATARFTLGGDQVVRVRATDVFGNVALAARSIFVRGEAEVTAGCTGREQYRTVTYNLIRAAGCWVSAARPNAGPLWVAHGDVTLNGLRLQAGSRGRGAAVTFPDCSGACVALQRQFNDAGQGRRVALDLADGHLVSNAPIAVKAAGSGVTLTLHDGVLDETLPETAQDDGLMFHPPGGAKLLSLDLASTAEVTFPVSGQAVVGMTVHLPPQMPGVGGDVTLRATETQGLILDHLKIEVQTGVLSDYLKLGSLSVEYDRADDQWTGHAELGLPGIKGKEFDIEVEIVIQAGKFKSIYGSVDGLEIALGEGIFLQRIRAGVGVDPLDLQGGLGISAGPKILGTQLLSADGDLRVTFPSAKAPYTLFQVAGKTTLLDTLDLSRGVLRFATNGFFEGRYGISRDVGIAYFDADLGGWFTFSKANFTGNAEAGIRFLGDRIKLAGVHAVLSTRGIAACGEIPVINLGGGVGYRWGDEFNVFTGCDLGPYSEARPEGIPDGFEVRAAATTAPAVKLEAGLRSAGINVIGRGGPPKVTIVDAKGRTVLDATKESLTPKAMVAFDPNTATTNILWKAPPKGKYLVIAAPGSPAIAKVRQAVDAGPQKVRVTVTGPATTRRLQWRVTPALQKGQELTLGEAVALDGAGHDITTTTKSSGTMAFTPQDGHGERRVVTATIITDGLGRPSTVAARFAAPRLVRPARPKGLMLTRSGRTVTLRWTPGAQAAPAGGWRVSLAAADLKAVTAVVTGKRRTYAVTGVPAGLPVSASVAGLGANRAAGAPAKATLAVGAARSGAATGAAAARPTALTVRRSGRKLVVRWKPGAERGKGYTVLVTIGKGAPVRLSTSARRPTVSVAGLPKGKVAVKVEVRAVRLTGGTSALARLSVHR